MILYKNIEIYDDGNEFICTKGLNLCKNINKELSIYFDERNKDEYVSVLKYIIDYILNSKIEIISNQTISYYSWILKFVPFNNFYDIWEAHPQGKNFIRGCDYSLKTVKEQIDICKHFDEQPLFSTFGQNIVISDGVYEGLAIDAIRYPSPNHMCGWWLITDLYDDDPKSLKNVHFYHVAFKRPDIIKYLALPFGYRFYFSQDEQEIWFDEEVLDDD